MGEMAWGHVGEADTQEQGAEFEAGLGKNSETLSQIPRS